MKKVGIYKITNTQTGKFYLGSSVNIDHRWRQHKHLLTQGQHHSPKLQASWNKHGADVFTFEIVLLCDEDELLDVEQGFLDALAPAYNASAVAGKVDMTPEVRNKIAAATTARYRLYDGLTLKEFCAAKGADWRQVYRRLARGLSMEEALRPVDALRTKAGATRLEYKGVLYTQNELAALAKVSPATMSRRLKSGMSVAQAVDITPEEMASLKLQKSQPSLFKKGFDSRRRKKKHE